MTTLASELRSQLERAVVDAREAAENGARAALEALAVHQREPFPHMDAKQRAQRNHLRARARQLGDQQDSSGRLAINHIVRECAYEHWHRMLFARFLAENNLLIEPQANIAISLAEAEELATEAGENVWVFASRCAQQMLPQIFRPDDPLLQITFAAEHMLTLERLLASLPTAVFTASDALGWVYQFWQSRRKDEVNRSGVKIGADELPAVTQLFTEPYMVSFLLHNTLGAWWAGKKLTPADLAAAQSEKALRQKVALPGVEWEYLRFVRDTGDEDGENKNEAGPWRPAAGTFDGWPKTAAEIKVLDPCCGSGHFLVAALHHLVPIRMAEEALSVRDAVDAVLRDNLHGLEIDERCCQIAAFALAFAAWKMAGYRELPALHIACSGIGPNATADQWVKLAEQSGIPIPTLGEKPIKHGLRHLHDLFSQAPTLGSLINPTELPGFLVTADYETIQPYLTAIHAVESADTEWRERAIAAAGMIKAAELLAGDYTLVITNVPYLGRGKQDDTLKAHLENHFKAGKADLATAFVLRCLDFCATGGSTALVTPQNWLFLTTYTKLRENLLRRREWNVVARLGEHAFESSAAAGAFAALLVLSAPMPADAHIMAGIDVSAPRGQTPIRAGEKAAMLRGDQPAPIALVPQAAQLKNPDAIISNESTTLAKTLGDVVESIQGFGTSDDNQFIQTFWEQENVSHGWVFAQTAAKTTKHFDGRLNILLWEDASGRFSQFVAALKAEGRNTGWKSGSSAWGKMGLSIAEMSELPGTIFTGEMYDNTAHALIPKREEDLPAIWMFFESGELRRELRKLHSGLKVSNRVFNGVPFDLAHWQQVAAEKYPNGLPEPESDDPTQWLFHGRPEASTAPLQVAVARLMGYRWPAELDAEMRLSGRARALVQRCEELLPLTDDDGIVCIPSVRGEDPADERLLAMLTACDITPEKARELAGGTDLDDWLRNGFFEEHCKLFHHRPFVWHVWDGRKRDGFHALVNYHKLAAPDGSGQKLLESLTYSYLGEWISRQQDGVKRGEGGAEDRLTAALELQKRLIAIIAGEPPFDIFVRWKPLSQQPIGWEPDINDGVRLNIRPFLASDLPNGRAGAGILRFKPNIRWAKDRGKEPNRPKAEFPWFWGWDEATEDFPGGTTFDGNRWNDLHYSAMMKLSKNDSERIK